jgi:glucose-1-phosphate thymidylyltransferase
MIYYPLTVMIAGGIRDYCVIATPEDLPRFRQLLGDGTDWGISIQYREQPRPEGIAQSILIADDFIGSDDFALVLGDNLFFGGDAFPRAVAEFRSGATIFAYHVQDPSPYAVVELTDDDRPLSIEEKPSQPRSRFAVPGVYLYDAAAVEIARGLRPSDRDELEITDVNRAYLADGRLNVVRLSRGFVWLDAGTSTALFDASAYVQTIEKRQGIKLGCPEEAAWRRGYIATEQFQALSEKMPDCEYRDYLRSLLD